MKATLFVLRCRRARSTAACVLLLAGITSACARAVEVTGDSRQVSSILVSNETPVSLVVSYHDGRADHTLGTVEPNRSERFIVTTPATSITVRGSAVSGSRVSGPYTVTLSPGTTVPVRLR